MLLGVLPDSSLIFLANVLLAVLEVGDMDPGPGAAEMVRPNAAIWPLLVFLGVVWFAILEDLHMASEREVAKPETTGSCPDVSRRLAAYPPELAADAIVRPKADDDCCRLALRGVCKFEAFADFHILPDREVASPVATGACNPSNSHCRHVCGLHCKLVKRCCQSMGCIPDRAGNSQLCSVRNSVLLNHC
jgi:hypothetical protein